jgi:CheY-like chemotaxis protein
LSSGFTILLVEDNPSDQELTLFALGAEELAGRVVTAQDGAEALDILFQRGAHEATPIKPNLVLLDLKLPKVDGLEVLREIKSNPRTRSIPVVVLTSSQEERDVVQSYDLGANSYVCKPVDFSQFTTTMRQLGLYWLVLNQPLPR